MGCEVKGVVLIKIAFWEEMSSQLDFEQGRRRLVRRENFSWIFLISLVYE